MTQLILTPENKLVLDIKISGGKGANLARLARAGFNVPPFFIISASFYEYIIKINRIDLLINHAAAVQSLENFRQIQSAILASKIPDSMIIQINRTFNNLIQDTTNKKVAVRSSALAEDLTDRSFAGQLETYLNIEDEQQLLDSIKYCWASLWNERVYHYISKIQNKIYPQAMAVIVQQMIPAEFSGVCFTIDPMTADQKWMIIEAHEGIGAEIVGGRVNPIRYQVHRKNFETKVALPDNEAPFLSIDKIAELARTCLKIEHHFNSPQDIEWAYYQHQFYLLQSRPMTRKTREAIQSKDKVWSNYFFGERFPQPVSPLGWSLLKPLIEKNAFREPLQFLGFHKLARSRMTKCFYGRPYTRLEVFRALHSLFPTAYVSSDKRKLFYDQPVSRRQSFIKIFKNIFPILKSLISTTDWIPPIHLRNWQRFLNYYCARIHSLQQFDLHSLSDEQLWQLNIQAEQLSDQLLKLHRWSITFAELIFHFIRHLIHNWLPQLEAETAVIELHRGLPSNKTIEMNIELWNLSRAKKQNWKSFIQKFGHRSISLDISIATFAEDRNYILELVKQYQSLSPELSSKKRQKDFEQLREDRYKSILQIISQQHFGFLKRNFFKMLMNWSEQFMLLRENQRHYWHHTLAINRKIFLEFGRRFVDRGWLEQSEHIFFLNRNEIEQALSRQQLVSKFEIESRIRQHQGWQATQPPSIIDESIPIQLEAKSTDKKFVGIGAGPGVVTGQARVLTALQEMAQIQPGEILVVPAADPGWTPLFGIIKGLVMEVGGVLSHGAIVAREFGIPAVTSVAQATSRILTGMKITVDGNKGEVWIHEA